MTVKDLRALLEDCPEMAEVILDPPDYCPKRFLMGEVVIENLVLVSGQIRDKVILR